MLSGSLKERLAQLKTLKEEEKQVEEKRAAVAAAEKPPAPVEEAPPAPSEPAAEEAPTPEVEEKTEEAEEAVEPAPEPVEEVEEKAPEPVEEDVAPDEEEPSQSEIEVSQSLGEQEQDVFKALDEGDEVPGGAPVAVKPKKAPKKVKDKPKSGSRMKCILCFFLWLICVAAAAIILTFYFLDYPEGFWRGGAVPETEPPTMSPTPMQSYAPTTLAWGQLLQSFLIPISGEEVFQDRNSPQYRAGRFILDDPYTAEIATTGRLNDRYASITFYFATGGENWSSCSFGDESCESGQWLVGDVCDWSSVSCDDEGRIVSYIFANADGNGMVGTLPPEMRLMSFMSDLVIVNNAIEGTIPEAFSESAGSLRSLLLPDNDLSGEISDTFFANSPLEFVHLANNKFSGPLPATMGETTTLQQLDLSGNTMSGTIPTEIGGYVALEAISLANNFFEGTIPEEIYDLTELKYLHLNGNDLSGTVSKSVGNLSLLQGLRVGGSGLAGKIPDELFSLTKLVELDISQSSFDGRLSLGFLNLEGLEKLNVADNKLSGTVPVNFGQLSELTDLNLEGNEFSGTIPDSVCVLVLKEKTLEVLSADCEEVVCECCTRCL